MEQNDDRELRTLLREWEPPPVPSSLEDRILRRRQPLWRFLFAGQIRVPVPVAICVATLIGVLGWRLATPTALPPPQIVIKPERIEVPVERVVERIVYRDRPAPAAIEPASAVELLPVTELHARIIRANEEIR
jgi:hypothetical protein